MRLFAILFSLILSLSSRAVADTDAAPGDLGSAVKSGGDALRSDNRFPWYDADHDTLRPVVLRQSDEPDKNDSDGEKDVSPQKNLQSSSDQKPSAKGPPHHRDPPTPPPDDSRSSNMAMPEVSAPWLIWIAWIVIGGVLAFLAVMLIRAFLDREARKANSSDDEAVEAEDDADRLDALPMPAKPRAKGTLLEEAQRCYEAGDYNTAIVYLYGYQLLKLDQNQWIRLAKGKTNREYLRELSGRGELQGVLARTMVPFEDVYFGDHPLDRVRFEACWSEVERFDRLVERSSA